MDKLLSDNLMYTSIIKFLSTCFIAIVLTACAASDDENAGLLSSDKAYLQISVPAIQKASNSRAKTVANTTIPDELTSLLIEVLDQKQTLLTSTDIIGNTGAVTLTVDPGSNYTVRGTAKAGKEVLFKGETSLASVKPGVRIPVKLSLADQVQLTVSPVANVIAGSTPVDVGFALQGLNNTAMKWYVNGIVGGSAEFGFIDNSGRYTPPVDLLNPTPITIRAEPEAAPSFAREVVFTLEVDPDRPQAVLSIAAVDTAAGGGIVMDASPGSVLNFAANTDFTIAMWVRPNSLVDGMVLYSQETDVVDSHRFLIQARANGAIQFSADRFGTGLDTLTSNPGLLTAGQWSFIAVSRSGNTVRFFHNGIEVGTGTLITSAGATAGVGAHYIGQFGNNPDPKADAMFSEVSVWNRALPANELSTTMITRLQGHETGLIACWSLDEDHNGIVVRDKVGSSYGAMLDSAVWAHATSPYAQVSTYVGVPTSLYLTGINAVGNNSPLTIKVTSLPASAQLFQGDGVTPVVAGDTITDVNGRVVLISSTRGTDSFHFVASDSTGDSVARPVAIVVNNSRPVAGGATTEALQAYYPFLDAGNTTVEDASGNANHGSNINAAASTDQTGALTAYTFPPGSYLNMGDINTIEDINQLTISAWVKYNNFNTTGDRDRNRLVIASKWIAAGGSTQNSFLFSDPGPLQPTDPGGYLSMTIGNGGTSGRELNAKHDLNTGQWYHLVTVFKQGIQETYIDGISVRLGDIFHGVPASDTIGPISRIPATNTSLLIGSWRPDLGYPSFDGSLDELRFYSRALSKTEVRQLGNSTGYQSVSLSQSTVAVTLSASDADGDTLSYRILSLPANGELRQADGTTLINSGDSLTTPGSLVFIPATSGLGSFTYVVNDGQLDSAPASYSIMVKQAVSSGFDSDGDGLPDNVETNTGIFAGTSNTGSNPNIADSDGDGFGDGEEVLFLFTDPNDPGSAPITSGIIRASYDDGNITNLDGSSVAAINADGSVIVYQSNEVSVTAGDDNGRARTLYLQRGSELVILNKNESGTQPAGFFSLFGTPSISDAGNQVVFTSTAPLVAADTNPVEDIYLRNVDANTLTLISSGANGALARGGTISGDGRYVAFSSTDSTLVANDTNGTEDIFIRDIQNGTIVRVSVDSSGAESNGYSFNPVLSQDGRYVSFVSSASNLVAIDSNGANDIFRHDRDADGNGIFDEAGGTETIRISVNNIGEQLGSGVPGNGISSISDDGGRIVFVAAINGVYGVYLRDIGTSTTELVSANMEGVAGYGRITPHALSGDGRYVVFSSGSSELVIANLNTLPSEGVFVKDTQTGALTFISAPNPGGSGAGYEAVISSNGRYIAFTSNDALVATDPNTSNDIYLAFNHTDSDGDRLNDYQEFLAGSDPAVKDTDGDSAYDGAEIAWGFDPTLPGDVPADTTTAIVTDFETDDGGFTGTGSWQYGTPSFGSPVNNRGNTGINLWATNLSGGYPGNQTDFLEFPVFTRNANTATALSFYYFMDGITFEDYAYMEVSLDNGQQFRYWAPNGGYPDCCDIDDNFNVWASPTQTVSGRPAFAVTSFDLGSKRFEGQIVQFRLRMEATGNNASNKAGMFIDDVYIGLPDCAITPPL